MDGKVHAEPKIDEPYGTKRHTATVVFSKLCTISQACCILSSCAERKFQRSRTNMQLDELVRNIWFVSH